MDSIWHESLVIQSAYHSLDCRSPSSVAELGTQGRIPETRLFCVLELRVMDLLRGSYSACILMIVFMIMTSS